MILLNKLWKAQLFEIKIGKSKLKEELKIEKDFMCV